MLTRSRSFKSSEQNQAEEAGGRKIKMSKKSADDVNGPSSNKSQLIMIAPNNLLEASDQNKDCCAVFHKLPHPKSNQSTVYAYKFTKIYELIKFKEESRSWFINDSCQSDGSLYILTPMDPLLLALPFLESVSVTGRYMTLEQILINKKYQTGLSKLENCLSSSDLETVCDFKQSDDFTAYKLSTEKVFIWLLAKVNSLAEYLQKESFHVGCGSRAANFVKSSQNGEHSHAEYIQYAFGLVSDYLADSWINTLRGKLNILCLLPNVKNEVIEKEPPAKRQKINQDNKEKCLEDYRDINAKNGQTKKPVKLTNGQKQLAKVDKTGMKSLNSFFTPKQKAKQ